MYTMILFGKFRRHILYTLMIFGFSLSALFVDAQTTIMKADSPDVDIKAFAEKIMLYKNDAIELELKIKHAELEVKKLLAVKSPEAEFYAKNEAIGLKYEITAWQEELKIINATIVALEKAAAQKTVETDKDIASNAIDKSDNNVVKSVPLTSEAINKIRKRQKALIEQSYTMSPAAAAFNLAQAKALEPLSTTPLFGEKSPLGSFFPASSITRYNGMMVHMGGNQYMLEAYLRPGKQEFVIGNMRFMRIVPVQYDGVISLILLDAQDVNQPALEYFAK
jgi:hypothetical protein